MSDLAAQWAAISKFSWSAHLAEIKAPPSVPPLRLPDCAPVHALSLDRRGVLDKWWIVPVLAVPADGRCSSPGPSSFASPIPPNLHLNIPPLNAPLSWQESAPVWTVDDQVFGFCLHGQCLRVINTSTAGSESQNSNPPAEFRWTTSRICDLTDTGAIRTEHGSYTLFECSQSSMRQAWAIFSWTNEARKRFASRTTVNSRRRSSLSLSASTPDSKFVSQMKSEQQMLENFSEDLKIAEQRLDSFVRLVQSSLFLGNAITWKDLQQAMLDFIAGSDSWMQRWGSQLAIPDRSRVDSMSRISTSSESLIEEIYSPMVRKRKRPISPPSQRGDSSSQASLAPQPPQKPAIRRSSLSVKPLPMV